MTTRATRHDSPNRSGITSAEGLLSRMLRRVFQSFHSENSSRRRVQRPIAVAAIVEMLELRQMLSANPTFTTPTSVTPSNGSVAFTGSNAISIGDTAGATEQLSLAVQHGTLNLASTTGLTTSGIGTGTVLLSGTVADLNAALAGLTYTSATGYVGADTFGMYVLNSGNNLSGNAAVKILATTAATAPTFTAPSSITATNGAAAFTGGNAVTINDTTGSSEQLSLAVQHGTLNLASTTGLTVSGNGTGTVLLSGSLSALNTALAGLTYSAATGYVGADTFGMYVINSANNLSGNAGVAIIGTNSATAPTLTSPTSITATNGSAAFTGGNAVSINDTSGASEQLSLAVQHGTLNLASTTGLAVSGNGTGTVLLSGTLSALNAALAGLTYTATTGYVGNDTLGIYVINSANNLTANKGVAITGTNSAVAPTLTAPASITATNGSAAVTGGNAVSINDTSGASEQLSLAVQHGTLSLASTTGLTVSGNGTGTVLLSGALSALNAALAGLTYTASPGYIGADTLGIYVVNSANNLSGNKAVTIAGTNSAAAPTLTTPASVNVVNGTVAFTGGSTVSVNDTSGSTEQLSLAVQHGSLNLASTTGLTFSGLGTGTVLLNGTLSAINAALAGLTYTAATGYVGSDKLGAYVINSANNLPGSGAVTIIGTNSAPAPTFTSPSSVSATNGTFTFTGGNAISITDTSGASEQLSLAVQHGKLTLASMTGLTVSGNGTGTVLLSGSLSALNAALAGLTYTATSGYTGSDNFGMYVLNSSNNLSGNAAVGITQP